MRVVVIAIFLVLSVCLFSGCLAGSQYKTNETATAVNGSTQETTEPALADSDIPLMGENDTVEIGEML